MPKIYPAPDCSLAPTQVPLTGAGPHDLTGYTSGNYRILVDSSTGAITVNLPSAVDELDLEIVDSGTNQVTCVLDGADTVNDVAENKVLYAYPESMIFKGEAGNWNVTMPLGA